MDQALFWIQPIRISLFTEMTNSSGGLSVYLLIPLFATLLSLQKTVAVNANRVAIRDDLASCLTGLNVTLPGDPAFQSECQTYNARLPYTPAAIVFAYDIYFSKIISALWCTYSPCP